MFKRMIVEDWATWIPIISFILIAGVFIAVTIRAIRISPTDPKHLESLRLEVYDS